MYRRCRGAVKVTEGAHETLARMACLMPKGSLIIGDSYFGGLPSLEAIVQQRQHVLMSCNSRRPSALNANYLAKKIPENGQSASCYGAVSGPDGEVPFIANAFRSEGRNLYTLSTVYSDTPSSTSVTALIPDVSTTDTDQHVFHEGEEMRPDVRNRYSELMDFVDNADSAILSSLTPHRKSNWSTNVAMWIVTMMLVVNAKRLYISASGKPEPSLPAWRKTVWRALADTPQDATHPDSIRVRKGPKAKCKSCYSSRGGHETTTTWRCQSCGAICKSCQHDGTHLQHASLRDIATRRHYTRSFSQPRLVTLLLLFFSLPFLVALRLPLM